jgi:hypothetical protein
VACPLPFTRDLPNRTEACQQQSRIRKQRGAWQMGLRERHLAQGKRHRQCSKGVEGVAWPVLLGCHPNKQPCQKSSFHLQGFLLFDMEGEAAQREFSPCKWT